jgi:hypothetical protein
VENYPLCISHQHYLRSSSYAFAIEYLTNPLGIDAATATAFLAERQPGKKTGAKRLIRYSLPAALSFCATRSQMSWDERKAKLGKT